MARIGISRELSVAIGVSLAMHAVWLTREAKASLSREPEIAEVTLQPVVARAKEPEPAPEIAPAPTNASPEPVVREKSARTQASTARALPAAAQAAKTLTAPDADSGELADFTMVQGEGSAYAGGTTSSIGTSTTAVRGTASLAPVPRQPTQIGRKVEEGADLSRSATPSGKAWDCSRLFPSDPDAGDYATVLIAVSVGVDGSAKRVAMLRDPGHGFGPAAIQCALGQRYSVALDRQGNPVVATTPPITVRFSR